MLFIGDVQNKRHLQSTKNLHEKEGQDDDTEGREAPFLKYDNDDNFSKGSHIGGDIIDSSITEGLMSLPPVESKVTVDHVKSKVTACNAMCATHSARNNIREGGSILEV
jgi:hypothetical protein